MKNATVCPAVELLLKARVLVEDNWCKGFGQGGKVCAVEALWMAAGDHRQPGEALGFLLRALPIFRCFSVIAFNDAKDTTKADILALYDRAIDLALKAEP